MTPLKIEDLMLCRRFINGRQLDFIRSLCAGEEGEFFRAKIAEMANIFRTMPKTYEQDGKGDQAVVHLHYFTGGCDWWITERDMEEVQHQAFGYADLGDPMCAELGYISIVELIQVGAEIDLHWTPKTLGEVRAERNVAA